MPLTMTQLTMIQLFNGLEMSLSNILKIDLFLSNNRMVIFLEQKKMHSYHSKHLKRFPIIRGSNIFSIRSDKVLLKVKYFVNTYLKFILEDNFYLRFVRGNQLFRNLRYYSYSTKNQNVLQPILRNLFANGSVSIEFFNEPIPYIHRPMGKIIEIIEAYNSNFLIMSTINESL